MPVITVATDPSRDHTRPGAGGAATQTVRRPRAGSADTGMLRADPADHDEHAREAGRTIIRLRAEFGGLARSTVSRVVRNCQHDLRGAPPGALAELVERLARERLRTALHLDANLPGR